jgi:hypothetical protein
MPFLMITLAQPGFTNRRAKWRVCVGPSKNACMLNAATREGRSAGLLVEYIRGTQYDAERAGERLAADWQRLHT